MVGQMRLEKIQNAKRSDVDLTASLQALTGSANTKFVFEEEERPEWTGLRMEDMSDEERRMAEDTWAQKNAIEVARLRSEDTEESYGLCCVHDYITKHMKLTTSALHDANLVLGLVLPPDATLLRHFASLHQLVGENARAYAPQNKQMLTVESIKSVLKCLQRGGAKFGGVTGNKAVLLERLQNVLKAVKQEGKRTQKGDSLAGEDEDNDPEFDQDMTEGASSKKVSLQVEIRSYGELPANAVVDFQQAESALGHSVADELDDADIQANDKDVQAEEEALLGRLLNPPGLGYSCFMPDFTNLDQKTCEQLGITSDEHKNPWTQDELVLTLSGAQQVLHDSLQAQDENFAQESLSEAMAQKRMEQMQQLDPTQKLAYDTLVQAVQSRSTWRLGDKPGKTTFHMLLLGTAGTGKTATVKASIAEVRFQLGDFKAVLMAAHTGVAASNMGAGAKTIDSIFKLAGEDCKEDLEGPKLHEFVESVRHSRVLVIDEISMVSTEQLELVSRRLEQAAKVLYRERHGRRAPASFGGFGGLHVLLVGDFGQIPPVSGKSLISTQQSKGEYRHLSRRGQERFDEIQNVICLRRVYRQKNAGPFLDSTLRLRDAALEPQDYDLYKEHELGVHRLQADWPGHEDFLKDALRLVAENQICGRLNGQQLRARTVPEPADPDLLLCSADMDVMKVVLRAKAYHSDKRAETKPSDGFRQLKDTVHLSLASPVMLTQNQIWQVNVVPLGLMNGARGTVVGVVYKQEGQARSDGSAVPAGFPCLREACPLPDFVIVNFPLYSGNAFFQNRPRTWVPVPCCEIRHSLYKSLTRYGVPLRCCWALTIHKCQGITAKEGCVVNFHTNKKRNVLLTPGLGFVATTRTEYYEKLAFENLPPYEDFLAIRNTAGFKDREKFEKRAVEKHNQLCKARAGWDSGDELRCHIEDTERRSGEDMTDSEVAALTRMLSSNGVQALSDDVFQFLTSQRALASGSSLSLILKSFKASRQTKKPAEGWKAGSAKHTKAGRTGSLDAQAGKGVMQFVISVLCGQGFEKSLASLAVKRCGSDIDEAVEFCLAHSDSVPVGTTDLQKLQDEQAEAEWIFKSLARVGLRELRLQEGKAKRRTATNSRALKTRSPPKDCHDQYRQRSMQHWPGSSFLVIDAGMIAASTTNACFWLSLVAAWSRLPPIRYADAELSALQDKVTDLGQWRPQDFADVNRRGGEDAFGEVAKQLRVLVTGSEGYLRGGFLFVPLLEGCQ